MVAMLKGGQPAFKGGGGECPPPLKAGHTFTSKKLEDRESGVKQSLRVVLSPLIFKSQGNAAYGTFDASR